MGDREHAAEGRGAMKRLYHVHVQIDLVVVAESDIEAEREAELLVDVEDDGAEIDCHATEVEDERGLPFGWTKTTIPFGGDDDRTIAEYLGATLVKKGRT